MHVYIGTWRVKKNPFYVCFQPVPKVETTKHDQIEMAGKCCGQVTTRTTSTEQKSLGKDRVRLPRCARLTSQYNKATQLIMAVAALEDLT